MNRIFIELKKHPWHSAFQLGLGGLMIFILAVVVGPHYTCGAGNVNNAFSCTNGSTSLDYKAVILLCILAASLCWGRAVSLLEERGSIKSK